MVSTAATIGAAAPLQRPRAVVKRVQARPQLEGDGAVVRRSIGRWAELRSLDPFLLLDDFTVSAPAGFPDHPHRGFETVTYMLEGAITHQDFAGNKGTIRAGDIQWMTAGRGIVHSEMPAGAGVSRGLQLWVNLSSKDKMTKPRYQELQGKDIPQVEKKGVLVRIIAGKALGVCLPVFTQTPTMYLDFTLMAGATLHQPVPTGWNVFVFVVDGEGVFGDRSHTATAHDMLVLGPSDGVSMSCSGPSVAAGDQLRFVLVTGEPLSEPVVKRGLFVMNTWEEIEEAMKEYRLCRNGFEMARLWRTAR
ncbi:hypothetical protein E2562_013588 [Oryza meyeriana var. granulata]|uniref:Pirin n=1 Tax=Oryza meyeriana var. granulata TaxID=110450 RepID=A0A6G1C5P0_9ORYZ|nr:hypothetical protein E2562_013588 [Oryza meyeriana var. granulata]